jgi:predicted nucleic acid-binding Zn ribbon protein
LSRRAPRPADQAMRGLLERLDPGTPLSAIQRVWRDAVGETIAAVAAPTGFAAGTLRVTCESAVWAQELDLMSPDLAGRLNAALGAELVVALRCSAAPTRGWASEG